MNPRYQLDQMQPIAPDTFWSIINAARTAATDEANAETQPEAENGFIDAQVVADSLADELFHLSTREVCGFYLRAQELEQDADRGGAFGILGYQGDCGYQYIVSWLIYQGRATFESVVSNPEPAMRALAAANWVAGELPAPWMAADSVFVERTGRSLI